MMPWSHRVSASSIAVELDHLGVEVVDENVVRVVDEAHPTGHSRREVAAGRTEDDDLAAGHVLAAVVTDALDDRVCARVAYREPLTHLATQELWPLVAPNSSTLPAMMLSSAT